MIPREELLRAAELIRGGRLVAFPTETVYGLGANALDAQAVARIFRAKRRPATSPLIVHVASVEMARELAAEWPEAAEKLTNRHWPGPLTVVLRKKPSIPDIVTAGLPAAGFRMPAHPVALELIEEAGVPIAAPSANPFTGLSPTTAEHVRAGLGDAVDMILDGGPTGVGIESTVLSLAGGSALLLRPGMVTRAEIEALIGPVESPAQPGTGEAHAAPGMHRKHYSPRTPVLLVSGGEIPASGRGAYVGFGGQPCTPAAKVLAMPGDPAAYAARLYRELHRLDREGFDWIAMERPPVEPAWAAIHDRLRRAAEK